MEEPVPVRYTFLMLLAIADPQGYVVGTDIAIARRLNISTEEFQRHVTELMKPDPDSNSHEEEGRRVISSDSERGYYVVNYRKYRDTRDEAHRREYMKEYMRERRAKNNSVNTGKQRKPALAQAEAEAKGEAEAKAIPATTPAAAKAGKPSKADKFARIPTDPRSLWLARLYHRRPTTRWAKIEVSAYLAVIDEITPEAQALIEGYYKAERAKGSSGRDRGVHRRDLATFLNNFTGELDRAREWAAENPKASAALLSAAGAEGAAPAPETSAAILASREFADWLGKTYSKKPGEVSAGIQDSILTEYRRHRRAPGKPNGATHP